MCPEMFDTMEVVEFARISIDPNQMGGVACIKGTRIPVATILSKLAAGMTWDAVLEAYPDLVQEDISEALRFAALALTERHVPFAA